MINTTNTKENIEQKEKHKGTQFLEELSLRDYFAAKAMMMFEWSMMTQADRKNIMDLFAAEQCYMVADAMLKAREQ